MREQNCFKEKETCCKHDFQKFVQSSKALNILFATSKHASNKSRLGYDLIEEKEKKILFIKSSKSNYKKYRR